MLCLHFQGERKNRTKKKVSAYFIDNPKIEALSFEAHACLMMSDIANGGKMAEFMNIELKLLIFLFPEMNFIMSNMKFSSFSMR